MIKNLTFWKNKKVFITGHTGFKGVWLLLFLNLLGAKVVGYSLKEKNCYFFKRLKIKNFTNIYGDVRNFSKLKNTLEKFNPNIIFHLAAQSLVSEGYKNPKKTYDINFNGTINLLEISSNLKKLESIFIITSDKVYENNLSKKFKEADKLGGADPYSNSKSVADLAAQGYYNFLFSKKKIGFGIFRAGNVYGGGDFNRHRLVPDIMKAIFNNKKLIIRNPDHVRPWQHVLDCIYKYLILSEKITKSPKKLSGSWNIGSRNKDSYKVFQIVKFINKLKKLDFVKGNEKTNKEKQYLDINTSKFNKLIKLYELNINKGIELTIEWYKNYNESKDIQNLSTKHIKNYLEKNI